jgi:hypothetical protein
MSASVRKAVRTERKKAATGKNKEPCNRSVSVHRDTL